MIKFRSGFVLMLLAAACSSEAGKGAGVAGGQSGTTSDGGYSCSVVDAAVENVPLDQLPYGIQCSPNQAFDALEGTTSYFCKESALTFSVSIERGSGARLLTGKTYSDTDPSAPPMACQELELDAQVVIQASDDSLSYAGPALLQLDHLCSTTSIDAPKDLDRFVLLSRPLAAGGTRGLWLVFPETDARFNQACTEVLPAGATDDSRGTGSP
jgi:hypothetical protein